MKRSRFTDSQILAVLKQAEAGTAVPDLCREPVDLVDLELFAIAKVCEHFKVPWCSLKFTSDRADGNAADNWQQNVRAGRLNSLRLYRQLPAR